MDNRHCTTAAPSSAAVRRDKRLVLQAVGWEEFWMLDLSALSSALALLGLLE